jgi:hypothetical protein
MRLAMRRRALLPTARLLGALVSGALSVLLLAAPPAAWAQAQRAPAGAAEVGPRWSELTPAQRVALKPLERDWSSIEADRKRKWMDIAARMPGMPPDQRERVQARMTEWARLSPEQRGQARLRFQESKQVSPSDRQAQWEAYQALPPDRKRQFQARAVPPAPTAPKPPTAQQQRNNDKVQPKSNIVPNPAYAAPPKPVAPTVVQAQPGATTSLISKRPVPPAHQQTGQPKIAATPDFVDKTTLLPRRGPQAAATRAPASAPVPRP